MKPGLALYIPLWAKLRGLPGLISTLNVNFHLKNQLAKQQQSCSFGISVQEDPSSLGIQIRGTHSSACCDCTATDSPRPNPPWPTLCILRH